MCCFIVAILFNIYSMKHIRRHKCIWYVVMFYVVVAYILLMHYLYSVNKCNKYYNKQNINVMIYCICVILCVAVLLNKKETKERKKQRKKKEKE